MSKTEPKILHEHYCMMLLDLHIYFLTCCFTKSHWKREREGIKKYKLQSNMSQTRA